MFKPSNFKPVGDKGNKLAQAWTSIEPFVGNWIDDKANLSVTITGDSLNFNNERHCGVAGIAGRYEIVAYDGNNRFTIIQEPKRPLHILIYKTANQLNIGFIHRTESIHGEIREQVTNTVWNPFDTSRFISQSYPLRLLAGHWSQYDSNERIAVDGDTLTYTDPCGADLGYKLILLRSQPATKSAPFGVWIFDVIGIPKTPSGNLQWKMEAHLFENGTLVTKWSGLAHNGPITFRQFTRAVKATSDLDPITTALGMGAAVKEVPVKDNERWGDLRAIKDFNGTWREVSFSDTAAQPPYRVVHHDNTGSLVCIDVEARKLISQDRLSGVENEYEIVAVTCHVDNDPTMHLRHKTTGTLNDVTLKISYIGNCFPCSAEAHWHNGKNNTTVVRKMKYVQSRVIPARVLIPAEFCGKWTELHNGKPLNIVEITPESVIVWPIGESVTSVVGCISLADGKKYVVASKASMEHNDFLLKGPGGEKSVEPCCLKLRLDRNEVEATWSLADRRAVIAKRTLIRFKEDTMPKRTDTDHADFRKTVQREVRQDKAHMPPKPHKIDRLSVGAWGTFALAVVLYGVAWAEIFEMGNLEASISSGVIAVISFIYLILKIVTYIPATNQTSKSEPAPKSKQPMLLTDPPDVQQVDFNSGHESIIVEMTQGEWEFKVDDGPLSPQYIKITPLSGQRVMVERHVAVDFPGNQTKFLGAVLISKVLPVQSKEPPVKRISFWWTPGQSNVVDDA